MDVVAILSIFILFIENMVWFSLVYEYVGLVKKKTMLSNITYNGYRFKYIITAVEGNDGIKISKIYDKVLNV